jgi:predicted MPP superfamily phosphohydrolase
MIELTGIRRIAAPAAPVRRSVRPRRWAIAGLSGLAVLGLLSAIWGFLIEPDMLLVRRVSIETAKWPATLAPLRIVAVSDIHAGAPYVDEAKLDRLVAEINAQDPDVVLLLGDYIIQQVAFGKPMPPETIAGHLKGLRAKHGVYAVLGNHDWYPPGGERVWRSFEDAGIHVLENRAVPLPGSNERIWLAGIADDSTRDPDPYGTFRTIPAGAAVVAFTHDPAVFPDIPDRAALTLAGHTHGGQVAVPFWGALFIPSRAPLRYAYGHIAENGNDLYVTSGIGTTALPVRFNAPPEIVVITLQAPSP